MKRVLLYIFLSIILFVGGMITGHILEWKYIEREDIYYTNNERIWPMLTAEDKGFMPDGGFVSDEQTALNIAKAVWMPIYGKKDLMFRRYRVALLDNSVWVIEGGNTLGWNGGGPFIRIEKESGTILQVSHTASAEWKPSIRLSLQK
jgi:hypothetical protein